MGLFHCGLQSGETNRHIQTASRTMKKHHIHSSAGIWFRWGGRNWQVFHREEVFRLRLEGWGVGWTKLGRRRAGGGEARLPALAVNQLRANARCVLQEFASSQDAWGSDVQSSHPWNPLDPCRRASRGNATLTHQLCGVAPSRLYLDLMIATKLPFLFPPRLTWKLPGPWNIVFIHSFSFKYHLPWK